MRPTATRRTATLAIAAICTGCYPALAPLPARAPAADIALAEVRNLEERLLGCHALRNALFEEAYEQRRMAYYLRQALAMLAAAGAGMSAVLDAKSGRSIGGLIALLSSVMGAVLPPLTDDGEGIQRAARQADEAWTRTKQEMESVEMAARAFEEHLRDRPGSLPHGASIEESASWLDRRQEWEKELAVRRRVFDEHYAALSAEIASCSSVAHGLAIAPEMPETVP